MKFFAAMTMRARLLLSFGFVIAIMLILTTLGIKKVNEVDNMLREITEINAVKQRYAINYRGSVHDRAIAVRDVGIARSASEINKLVDEINELERFYNDSEQKMAQMINSGIHFSDNELIILDDIELIKAKTLPIIEQVIAMSRDDKNTEQLLLDSARPAFIDYLNKINEFIDYQESQNQQATKVAKEVAGGFQNLMLTLSAIALIVSLIVAFLIERHIRQSLGGEPLVAKEKIKQFAEGDLTDNQPNNHAGSVLHSLTEMGAKLTRIAKSIQSASVNVSQEVQTVLDGSTEILDTADSLNQLTTQTSDKLIVIKDSTDQVADLATQTKTNSEHTVDFARNGKDVAEATSTEIEKIANTVNNTVIQIKELENRTKQIGGIINVISGISEQTNLLALNAAIEAARAGESGRGFAVVADEVRQLAKSTQDATAQIEEVITQVQIETAASVAAMETTQPQVENGKQQIEQTRAILDSIADQANSSLELVNQVADASADQVNVISDISDKMEMISSMSTESVDIISKNQNASQYLAQLSEELKNQISFFKVK